MKRTWIVLGSVVTVVVLAYSTSQAVGLLAHEEVTETETFAAADLGVLLVSTDNGYIDITGDPEATEVTVVAEISHGLQRTRHSAFVGGETLSLRSSCPFFSQWCSVDYRITVPSRFDVLADGDNGRVTLRDIDGEVEANSDNGRVELVRLTGNVRASSNNGRITGSGLRSDMVLANGDNGRVELTFGEPPLWIDVDSDNGSIEIVVPDTDDTYVVDASSDNGSTDIGVRTDPASDRTIEADADNGSVTVRYP